jgi:hypothetical protein
LRDVIFDTALTIHFDPGVASAIDRDAFAARAAGWQHFKLAWAPGAT